MGSYYWIKVHFDILQDREIVSLPDRLWRRLIELSLMDATGLNRLDKICQILEINQDALEADIKALGEAGLVISLESGWKYRTRPESYYIKWEFTKRIHGYLIKTGHGNPLWPELRERVLERDSNICRYCGAPATHVDHVVPKCQGGDDDPDNLVAACALCNLSKGGRTPEQAGMVLNA